MQRQNSNPYQQGALQQQQQQQSQQFISQEQQQQYSQQVSSSTQQQQSFSRTEHHVQRSQVTTQQRVQQHHGGTTIMQQQQILPSLTHVYAQGDISPPVFEQIFRNARFAQGGNAMFEGKLRGNPKPFVTWTRKGAPLLESHKYRMNYNEVTGEVSLLINQIGPGDEGEYTCSARNQYGEAICSVFIQPEGMAMPVLQPIQTHDKSMYTNGYSFTSIEEEFRVDTFEYRLLREVSFRESITRRTQYESDFQLSTEVDRALGPAFAPQINTKPRNSKLVEGSDAVFTAKVGSNPKPRLTWFRNGQRIMPSAKHEISYSSNMATLRVKNANLQDAGHYTLLVENVQGCVVSSAVLAVEPATESSHEPKPVDIMAEQLEAGKALPPQFVRAFTDREATEGRMTRFDCRVTGNPYPEVYWFINGQMINDDATHKILVNESGSHSLMITNVSRYDGGAVQCLARNKAGEVAIEAQLNVLEKEQVVAPQFVQRFQTLTVREGEPVALSANAIGTPVPRITWQKDGVQISSTQDRFVGIDGGATCLELPRATPADAGWYQCTAQNVAGSTANRARLYVLETPRDQPQEQRRLQLPRPTKVIEPEPVPGPEIIYLRHVERAKPHLRPGEEDRVYPPPQFIIPLQNVQQTEGGRVHMEARIEPVGDPSMVVEWFLNGRPLAASSRATSVFKFGFIALDLITIIEQDSGEYMCRVTNATGMAESRGILTIVQRPSIEQRSQHPSSLQYISQLEDYSKYSRQESTEELMSQKPAFIKPLYDLGEFEEGKNIHFEAQLTPVNDPTMRVEWYKDGRPITASSRITAIFNFGYVSLNIMHLRAEDAGSYTVRAVNRVGEAISTSTIRVISRSQVTADLGIPEQQRYIEKVEELEQYQKSQHKKYVHEVPEPSGPPVFKTPIKDQVDMREGAYAHFEARLEPVGDSTMRVEWLKDGRPLEASSRSTTFFNFGYVALTIKQLTIYDAGVYTCRAYNSLGQATTSANLTVLSKKAIVSESQHPGGMQKIQHLEDSSRYARSVEEETKITQIPRFLGPMKGTNKILEGQRAHFEARVEPQSDLSMKIEWYHNGKAITAANRIQTYYDFGYVALDISAVRADDAGVYTVVARNKLGEAQLSATMVVETRSSIDTSSMHRGLVEKTRQLEGQRFVEPQYDIEEISKSKPIFVQPLSDPKPMHEGKNIHLECRLEPMGDPTMRVEWFQNGRPITVGSRFRTYYDFGFVALDIVQTIAADSGEYTCRATNHLGSAHTSACVRIIDRSDIVTETQNEMSLEQIQLLEDASRRRQHVVEEITVMQAPQFTRPLHNIETMEGTNVHLECRLQPVGDPTMHVEWFVNGQPCKTGHRFRPAYEFDYVALDLLGVYAIDSGVYTCQARNQLGEAVTSCSVRIIAKKDLVLDTQNASGLQKIQYLEDSSRYKRSEYVDETINIRPRFLTHPKNLGNMREGAHAHFECKIEPVTDPNLKVEWFKNGRPITIGHRFRPIHDFGYVALDIVDLIAEDSGVYTCRAQNLVGADETRCELICRSSEQIVTVTQNEAGLEQIHYLEDRSKYSRREEIDETTKQAPVFTTSLKNIDIKENQRAHFECRLIPVSDPTMKVEWYHNNQPLKSGSRFTETNNFGFVALDIMSCLPEDAGTYTCRAYNAIGEAVTSAIALVHTKKSIYMESQHEGALHRLQYLEESAKRQKMSAQEEVITQAPVFTMPVRDVRVAENQAVHFEARLIPVGDPHLTVEWLHNGQPIEASNRVTTMHDFGYVALNMKYVNPEDSGTYTCRAVNELGQAVTSATLIVQSKAALQMETQNEAAMHKIHQLEDHTKYTRREEEEIEVTQPPRFITRLIGPTNLVEGQSAHYECRIEPYPDPALKVEWFHNGKPLTTGHRFRNTYDFGFAALDVLTVYADDSGEYTCRVTNNFGTAISSINLNVQTRSSIIRETQHEGALEKIQYLEDDTRFQRKEDEDIYMAERPQFGRPLRNANVAEGRPVHLEATLTPVNDPTMKVEWYCNGIPIQTGHRFKTTYDFGFVALDILYAHAEDTGTYMCKAKNAVGEAVTTSAVNVTANATLVLDTMDEQRLEKIRQLESYERPKAKEIEEKGQKPVFLTPLTSLEHLKEGEHAHLECRVEPINDANLKIEWFRNGKAIGVGHRFRTTHDFGYVALDILYAYGEDTGTYMCKATNLLGEAMNTCNIRVLNRRSMILDTQHPDALEKIQKLEAKAAPSRQDIDDLPISPPHFTVELRGNTEIYEGKTAHFEAQVQPMHDPNLRIEFYHNGKPLPSASRFHITFDFGYVALDISHAVAEDAGEYSVRAVNNLGQCTSSTSLRVIPFGGILSETQHPEGLEKIRALESSAPFHRPEVEGPQTRQRPVFTQPLQNIDRINEAQTAHFEARLIPVGDPNLKVEWYRNEKLIEDSSRITKQHDFGFVSLDISHIRKEDEGVYMCRAVNPLGEAVTTASMRVVTEASIQMDTQHPESIGRIHQLERPTAPKPEEPERMFEKPIFTQLLTGPSELWEGQHAHFEARVVPVGDPTLRFEWYVNGVELQMGSRLRTTHDFGFVTLDISSVVKEDSGMYMCRAYNAAGEAVSSTGMKVKTKSSIAGEPLIPESWEAIRLKEAAMNRVPEMFVDTSPQQAPVFTTHLQSFDKLSEGQHVRLEAQVEPRADPNLRIEWFKNGITLTTGARIRSTFDFGLVNLSINGLRADDSGIYTCKATNLIGEAVSTSSLKIEDRHWLMADTLHPESLPRIDALEAPKEGRPAAPEPVYESPVFITHLNNIECKENESVRFECNVEPARDPTMRIEWFYNGNPLPAAAKFKSIYDFGYCALDLTSCYAENSGIYTCKATNSKGSATTSGTLKCTGDKSMFFETQHPQGPAGLQAVQETEEALANRNKPKDAKPEAVYPPPVWTVPLSPEFKLSEGQPLHLEGNVEPKEDPNLFIEWYFNGKLLQHGSRFKMTSEFGFVTLDLIETYERDQGMYTCKAYNRSGEAFTQTTIFCSSKESIIERTQHPKGAEGLEQIQDLEESLRKDGTKPESPEDGQAPRFTTEFVPIMDIGEGEIAHFEANLVPTGDQTMVIEWFYNGKVLDAGHRFRTIYAFGMVALEVLGTKIEDSGTYTCRATNKWGTAEIHVELGCVDKPKGQKPRFTTHIQSLEGLKDGQSAHFECTLIPVNDPELKVEWYHNGKLLRHSNRIKPVSDFGYVLLDIAYLQDHDSGEYVCRAWNKYGEDFTRATLNCRGRGGVFSDTLQPDSLQRIRELECPQMGDQHGPTTPTGEPPKFITQISDATKLVEGQSAHFEARLTPITDPELVVEWYFNGKKLPHGHRFRTFHDFGIVILDILYCYEENSGVYECRAYNKYGEDVTRATLKCSSKASLILDSQLPRGMEGGLEKIQNLEYSMVRSRDETVEETRGKAPVFTVPLSNIDNLREGENAHFEARLTPTNDPKLKVEWYWNGKPLRAGSRFRTFCDFGFVILEISPVYPEDSGEFSCRAINEYGEAVTTATMKIQGKRSIIMESQLPKGMEGTIDRIAELEGLGAGRSEFVQEDDSGKPPEFITTPFDMVITENSLAHFECRLQPINDQSMRVEWFHNGKALWAGSRIKTINDFGFVILEIAGCYQRDSGLYTCKATNKHGEASVSCKLQVRGRQGIIMEPQLPSNFRSGTESLQKLEESLHKREEIFIDEEQPNPPKFTEDIKDNLDVQEGGPIHFDCKVEPVGDPTMRIDWFFNGRSLATGSRVHMLNDFGFIALDIDYIYARDSGEYICRATNKWGTAQTVAKVTCKGRSNIVYDSQLPDSMTAEKLKELERGRIVEQPKAIEVTFGPPKFITEIASVMAEEAEAIRFECQVEPKEDPKLRIEWYHNGKMIPIGHRYRTVHDMGFVSLDILYVYSEDSGEYTCRAVNDFGEDRTVATISCKQQPSIVLQNQVPRGMHRNETITQMEAAIKRYTSEVHLTEDDLFDPDRKQPPRFVTQIKDQTKLTEMQSTKFECQLAPVGDPNMKVEWFFNGKPLLHKNRFMPIYDFGYVAMNFGWVYPEDSGEYVCRATNLYGKDETRAIIKTTGKPGIVYDSQVPSYMNSIERIREMEASWQVVPEEPDPDAKPRCAPTFVSKLEPQTVEEGEPARFCVRVTGHPRPRVMWLINGHTVVHGSRYKLTNDGMFHLDVPKTRQYDTGKVEVIARNSVGEAIATTELKVIARSDDYRSILKNSPRPWYDQELSIYQKERQENELEKTFEERKHYLAEQSGANLKGVEHLKQKVIKPEVPAWQKTVKSKKNEDYYSKLQELETEQLLKETKLREEHHQFAIPGQKVVATSAAKGMAQNYEESLEKSESLEQQKTSTTQKIQKKGPIEPSESSVHGREVHMNKQKQVQKQVVGDLEITRKITATETTEVEHKGTIQERVVEGPVQPAKPPVFTKKIQPCRAFENEQAKFEVEFDGEPMPTIKWYRESFPIQNSPDLQIHTFGSKSVLIIRQVFVEDSAVFSCVASNRGGTAKCSANLVVEERRRAGKGGISPPSFVQTIQSTNVATGQLARFDAKVTGTKPYDVYWLKNSTKIQPNIKYKMLEEDNIYTLLVIEPTPEDSGRYECVAVNAAGEARCDADCFVQSPTKTDKPTTPGIEKAPVLVEPLKNQSVEETSKVIFKCRVVGKPTPTARWYRGDNMIKPSRYFQMTRQGEYYQLVISEAFPEDEGVYKCVLDSKMGTVQTSATLKVRPLENLDAPPTITALKDVTVTEGLPAQFKTTITGKVKATGVQWLREGQLIPETPDFQMIFDGNSAVLLIGTTYEEDSGIFTARVTSSTGQVESSAKLTVKKRRISAYQLQTIDSVEDESSSGKEDSSPESPQQQHLYPPQYTQNLQVNGHSGHRPRSKKPRSKSLQPQSNLVPWRKSSRPRRGRSLEKQPFLPGFKPEPVKSWTEEPILLKPATIEKKVVPKYEVAKVFLKSIKDERDQGLLSIGYQLEKIIEGKTEKEAIPWVTMREKLRAVERVQKQLESFDLEDVYLSPLQHAREEITPQQPQQAQQQIMKEREIERLKSFEDGAIMDFTEEVEKLISTQPKTDTVPWKEMRKQLKSVQKVHKQIEKFKIEEVELKSVQVQTATSKMMTMTVDESSKASIEKVMTREDIERYEQMSEVQKQQYITTEDINILTVEERERLEAQRLISHQQATNWRKPRTDYQKQNSALFEDSSTMQVEEDTRKVIQQQATDEIAVYRRMSKTEMTQEMHRQEFTSIEDTNIMRLQKSEWENSELIRKQEEPVHWRRGKTTQQVEETRLTHVEDSTFLDRREQEVEEVRKEEAILQPTHWRRGKPTEFQQIEDSSFLELKPEEIEEVTKKPEDVPVMWERGKRKPQQEVVAEELAPVEQIKPKPTRQVIPQQPEQVEKVVLKPIPRQKPKQQEIVTEDTTIVSEERQVIEEQEEIVKHVEEKIEERIVQEEQQVETQQTTVPWLRGRKKEPQQPEMVEQVSLKPTPRQKPKPQEVVEEVQLKPISRPKPAEIQEKVTHVEKVTEEITEEIKKVQEEVEEYIEEKPQEQPKIEEVAVPWVRGKKAAEKQQLQEPEKVEQVALKPTPRQKPKPEAAVAEEVQLKPISRPKPVEKPEIIPQEEKVTEEVIEEVRPVQEEVEEIVQPEEQPEQPTVQETAVPWKRGKKAEIRPQEPEKVEQVTLKPTPRKQIPKPEPEKPEEVQLKPFKRQSIVEIPQEPVKLEPIPQPEKTVVEELVQPQPQEGVPWQRGKKQKPQAEEVEEKSWPTGKRKPLEKEPEEPISLKPVPRPAPEEEKVEEVALKPVKRPSIKPQKEQIEEVVLKPVLRQKPKPEPEEEIQVVLAPVQKPEVLEEEKPEKPTVIKKKPKEEPVPVEEVQWPKGKRRPLEPEPKEEVHLKPVPRKPVPEAPKELKQPEITPKPQEEIPVIPDEEPVVLEKLEPIVPQEVEKVPEEVKLPWVRGQKKKPEEQPIEEKKWPKGKIRPQEPEPMEEVHLKPVPRKPVEEVVVPEEKPKKTPKPKHEKLPEIPDAEPIELEKVEPFEIEKVPEVPVEQPAVPWKRGEKKKPVPEQVEEKQWPTGRRKTKETEVPEQVQLKPIPRKQSQVEEPLEAPLQAPVLKPEEPQQPEPEEEEIIPEPIVEEEEPRKEKERKKKKKPKLHKATPSVDEVSEEEVIPFQEPIAEEDQVDALPVDVTSKIAVTEEVLPHTAEEILTEEIVKQRAHKKRTKRLKEVSFDEQPQLLDAEEIKEEEIVEEEREISQKTVMLQKKKEEPRPQYITTEQLIEVDVDEVHREIEMKLTSNIVKKERRRIHIDDSQPLPELELITQKRIQEGLDKLADEELIEDEVIQQTSEQTISEVQEQERKIVRKKKREVRPPRITEKLRPRECVPDAPAVLECKVEGIPFPEINWYFNDTLLFASEKYEMSVVESVAKLKIVKVTPQDVGVYTCQAKNEGGVATSTANVLLERETGLAPQFVKPLKIEFTEQKPERCSVTVTCQVEGIPKPKVKWYRGKEELIPSETVQMFYDEETGEVALEVINPPTNEAIVYSVQAENTFGRAVGNANILREAEPTEEVKEILKAPTVTPLTVKVVPTGGTLVFESVYDGIPKPEIKWMRNGREVQINEDVTIITTETTTTITVKNMTRKRTGKYEICAKNPVGEAKSSGSVVVSDSPQSKEIQPPRFIEPLKPKFIAENEVAILEAVVESEPVSSFQWFVHTEPIKSSTECRIMTEGNKSVLLIENFTKKFAGPYTCRAENVGGSVTSTATVDILEDSPFEQVTELISPRFVEPLSPVQVMDGEKLYLICEVHGQPIPRVEWFHNEEKIIETKETVITQDIRGVCTLSIAEVFPEDDGQYKCVATNKIGEAITTTTVNIQAFEYIPDSEITGQTASEEDLLDKTISLDETAPKIIKKLPELVQPKEGELAKLEVKVIGKPKPKIKWLRDNEEIFASEEYQIENFEDGTSVLVINHVYPDDVGTISFEAYNPLGVAVTTAEFAVEGIVGTRDYRKPEWVSHMEEMQKVLKAAKCSPTFVSEMRDCRAALGESATFEVQFSGNPHPDVQWYFNDVQLRDSDKYRIVIEESTSTLTILNVTDEDKGYYICKIINEIAINLTRAKFDICSVSQKQVMETSKQKKFVTKKKLIRKTGGIKRPPIVPEPYSTTSVESTPPPTPRPVPEVTVEVIKVRQPVSVLVEQSGVSEVQIVKDRKEADAELLRSEVKIETQEVAETELKTEVKIEKEEISQTTSTTTTTTSTTIKKVESIEITETVKIIRQKISQKSITQEDVLTLKKHEEVNWILTSIEAETFGAGEAALRDLATIGLLLRYGVTISEIIYMYEEDIFISLKKPESQSALVTLVERMGHDNLITIILSESSTEDESILAATVGFKAFIRMIETCEITIEEVIRKFVREDFIVQDWKISTKERVVETSQVIDSNVALTHIKVAQTYIEETTIVAVEGVSAEQYLEIDPDEQ